MSGSAEEPMATDDAPTRTEGNVYHAAEADGRKSAKRKRAPKRGELDNLGPQ